MTLPLLSALAATVPKTTHTYKTAGDCLIRVDVYHPPGRTVVPAVLWIHGGALIMGSREGIPAFELNRYLDAGLAVVSIDYRLAPETKLADILDDVADAYRWLRGRAQTAFRIDPNRIAVVGHSAGGYLALVAGYNFKPRPRAVVAFYGYGDIAGGWYSRPDPFYSRQPAVSKEEAYAAVGTTAISGTPEEHNRGKFYLYCRQQGLWPDLVTGLDLRKDPSALDRFCPLLNVSSKYPPTLLLHGDQDTDVPFTESERMANELKRNGVAADFVRIPGGAHGFDRNPGDPQVGAAFDRVIAFLRQYLH